ncbi:hypothetical protein [Massilia sp. METH4]|uniref:DUF6984 family protein n=1 Tax=Massilia sp. METH4 TaxID=3123041 RepID=UPI0030CEDBEC
MNTINPRRVHELMKANFPNVDVAKSSWINVLESDGTVRSEALFGLMDRFVHADELLAEACRKTGGLVRRRELASYVQKHVGRGDIRLADMAFHGYVMILRNGVATGGRCRQDARHEMSRSLRMEEDLLIRAMLRDVADEEWLLNEIEHARVCDMDNGAMRSLRFAGDDRRSLGPRLVEAEYVDSDGVLVSLALNVDKDGRLYELDIWKVDFSPLREYPTGDRIVIRTST